MWTSFQVNLEVVLHAGLNVYRENSGCSWLITLNLLMWYKWSKTRSTSCSNLIFPLCKFYQRMLKRNSKKRKKNMHCLWIQIKKSPRYKSNYNIEELSKAIFLYHRNDTKKNFWVMLCSHCPINDSSGCLHVTVYLEVMLQGPWRTAEGN